MNIPRSPEPIGTIEEIRDWIISGSEHEMRFAIQGAARYSIGMIDQLLEDLSYEHDANCDRFLRGWLDTLDPLERLAAAVATEHHYRLGLVGTVRADDRALLQVMEAVKPGTDELAECFSGIHERADDPDPSFTRAYTTQLLDYAEQLQAVAEKIGRGVRLVKHMSNEVVRMETGAYDAKEKPAKIIVAELLEENLQLRAKIISD
ncbi:hypothetical protein [Glutamicibacter sp. Je.9.36]|uniref:hypothetical protein n=1 Tax=Glutamicibacter sp. Je.9.36 TaxID=3142837 RepID=UPI003DA851CB